MQDPRFCPARMDPPPRGLGGPQGFRPCGAEWGSSTAQCASSYWHFLAFLPSSVGILVAFSYAAWACLAMQLQLHAFEQCGTDSRFSAAQCAGYCWHGQVFSLSANGVPVAYSFAAWACLAMRLRSL